MAPKPLVLAVVGAPHGVRGEVRVKAFAADPTALGKYGVLQANDGRALEIERLRPAKDVVIVKFRGVDDRSAAEALNGVELSVDQSALPAPGEDEFYHADLIGLEAFDPSGTPIGRVVTVQNHGAGDILEIAPPRRPSILVLFTKVNVPDIDVTAGRLTVVLPVETEVEAPEERQ